MVKQVSLVNIYKVGLSKTPTLIYGPSSRILIKIIFVSFIYSLHYWDSTALCQIQKEPYQAVKDGKLGWLMIIIAQKKIDTKLMNNKYYYNIKLIWNYVSILNLNYNYCSV